jgi:hypothetical protein
MAGYGVDILDPAVTPRRVAVLIRGLPPYARRAGQEWSTESELLALLVDRVADLTYITARAAGAKNFPRPRPLPRPRSATPVDSGRNASLPPERPEAPPGGGVKTGTWAEAISMLAGIPGVKVVTEDG